MAYAWYVPILIASKALDRTSGTIFACIGVNEIGAGLFFATDFVSCGSSFFAVHPERFGYLHDGYVSVCHAIHGIFWTDPIWTVRK